MYAWSGVWVLTIDWNILVYMKYKPDQVDFDDDEEEEEDDNYHWCDFCDQDNH